METWRGNGGGEGGGIEGKEGEELGGGELGAVIGAFNGFDGMKNLKIRERMKETPRR